MDACKAAVKALRNSPAAVRRKISNSNRRQKLKEDWLNENDAVMTGITFFVKFLGSVPTTEHSGEGCTDLPVRQICASAKRQREKLEKISLRVSAKSITLSTLVSEATILEYPIYKVTYCTMDPYNDKIFAFIAQCPKTLDIICYAFLCNKKSKTLAITLSVAQAFNIAYEMWEKKKERQRQEQPLSPLRLAMRGRALSEGESPFHINGHSTSTGSLDDETVRIQPKVSLPDISITNGHHQNRHSRHVSSPNEQLRCSSDGAVVSDDELDTEFTRLALSRSTPNLLDIGHVQAPESPDGLGQSGSEDDDVGGSRRGRLTEFKNGENNPAVLYRMVSREDLLSPADQLEN